ncbi:MAG: hypothetical protein IJ555_02515 [Ruminococcus sp.]|nr:hypothetical protein [Ruminococcus sp.]
MTSRSISSRLSFADLCTKSQKRITSLVSLKKSAALRLMLLDSGIPPFCSQRFAITNLTADTTER